MLESWNMKKFLAIVIISLVYCSNALSKEILLKCKYTSGFTIGEDRDESAYKGRVEFIKLNLKNKKIIDAPYFYGTGNTNLVRRFLFWDDDEIWWGEENKDKGIRRSGLLERETGVFETKIQLIINKTPYWEQNKYICEVTTKKLF